MSARGDRAARIAWIIVCCIAAAMLAVVIPLGPDEPESLTTVPK